MLITDHSSTEGSSSILRAAVERLVGAPPVSIDSRHFMSGGTGRVSSVCGTLTLEVAAEEIRVSPSVVLIYEIPPAARRHFEHFQGTLRRLGVISPDTNTEAWRNATEKDRTVECFLRDGVPHMDTVTLWQPSLETALDAFDRLGRNVWTRPAIGLGGADVFHLTTHEQLRCAVRHYADAGLRFLMAQDALNFTNDGKRHSLRVIVLQGRPLVAVEHVQPDPDKPCNEAQGAISRRVSVQDLPHDVIEVAIAAVRSTGLWFGGVDLAMEKRGVFEVNVHPVIGRHLDTVAIPLVSAHLAALRHGSYQP